MTRVRRLIAAAACAALASVGAAAQQTVSPPGQTAPPPGQTVPPPGQTPPGAPAGTAPTVTPPPATPQIPWGDWLAALREEALMRGISASTVDLALTNIEPLPLAVERDRTQPELVLTLDAYIDRYLTSKVIQSGRDVAKEHAALLKRVSAKYGVPAPIIVGVWGMESNFGKFTGSRPIIQVLATLAYDGRRALFRSELFNALTIIDKQHLRPDDMKGSWAGAMGQPQFMPSSYLKFAVDFDGDGQADIWTSEADVFGSVANYLEERGWTDGARWGREVRATRETLDKIDADVPMRSTGCKAVKELTEPRPLSEWRKLGVTLPNGKALPKSSLPASLVRGDKRHFLVYKNYEAILDYNCANSYAITVGLLADAITAK